MVKRILALSLLMVGLAACGSGGGASAEADTLNTKWIQKCNCSAAMYDKHLREHRIIFPADTSKKALITPICDPYGDKTRLCSYDRE